MTRSVCHAKFRLTHFLFYIHEETLFNFSKIQLEQQIHFLHNPFPFSFTQLCKMSVLSLNNQTKQNLSISKPQIWLFDTLSTKKSSQVAWFHSTSIFQHLYFYFVLHCLVIYFQCVILFMSLNIAYFMKRQTRMTIKQLNGIP